MESVKTDYNRGFIYFICLISAMGGLLFGYDWVGLGGAKPFYEAFFGISDNPGQQGLAMSIALAGCLVGAMVCGSLADRIGRRPLLLISALIFLVSAYATGAFNTFTLFLGAQIVNYLIAEPMPAGTTVPAPDSWNVLWGWRWMFWSAAFPAALFLLLALFIPESPRWLALRGRKAAATAILARIGGEGYARSEMAAIAHTAGNAAKSGLRALFTRPYAMVITLGICIAVFQQWCGTNVIFNYAQEIFSNAGYDLGEMLFNIVLTGITNVVFTFAAIYSVDRLGRKKLMLIGAGGLALIYAVLGTCYFMHITGFLMVILVVAAIACYAMTLGPVTWVLIAELFPNRVRAVAVAVCTFALWTASFTLTYTFPLLNTALGSYGTFWIYAGVCAAGFIFFSLRLPETKGKSLEELEKELVADNQPQIISTDF